MLPQDIGRVLKERLASLTFSPAIPVAWPNRDFKPTVDRYLLVQLVYSGTERLTMSGRSRITGALVVNVNSKVGSGSAEGEGIAGAIMAHFPVDLKLDQLRVLREPEARDGFEANGYWVTPVVVAWEVLT